MPVFEVTSPDGQTFEITAPEGATQEQALEYAKLKFAAKASTKPVEAASLQPASQPETKQSSNVVSNVIGGALRGAGSIGTTIMQAIPTVLGGDTTEDNAARRKNLDQSISKFTGGDPDSLWWKGSSLGAEIAGTAGIGGVLAKPLAMLKSTPAIEAAIQSLKSGGFNAGNLGWSIPGALTRILGGSATGAAMAGSINPDDVKAGAIIGGSVPIAGKTAGLVGSKIYDSLRGGASSSGKALSKVLDLPGDQLKKLIDAAADAPTSIIPGSNLTLSQALQLAGKNTPAVQMIERVASGGPGGDVLLQRFADQNAARINAFKNIGADTSQGAANQSATDTGNLLGSVLRTQAADDRSVTRALWETLNKRAADDGVALQLPLDQMKTAMKPLGRGMVGAGGDARSILNEAQNIGTVEIPAIKVAPKIPTQSLEQAVRSMGGIRPTGGYLDGEIASLTNKQSGTTGLISKNGVDIDRITAAMHERGFIPDNDPAVLLEMLRNGQGRNVFANDISDNAFQRGAESAMGDLPVAERIPVPVPFDEFQRLRSSAGELAAKASGPGGSRTESGVLNNIKGLIEGRVNDAAAGNLLLGEVMPEGFKNQYNAARSSTRSLYERYGGGNNIESILRKPVGQDYSLTGDEITNKLWHGGPGLVGDVQNFKNVLNNNNVDQAVANLQKHILTDAASKTTAGGLYGAALPSYVEKRMAGLQEALTPEQMDVVSSVARDIRNSDASKAIPGLIGSDTHAKIARAFDAGLLDSSVIKKLSSILSVKGIGLENIRSILAESLMKSKGKAMSGLLADPKAAAAAMRPGALSNKSIYPALEGMYRVAPLALTGSQ